MNARLVRWPSFWRLQRMFRDGAFLTSSFVSGERRKKPHGWSVGCRVSTTITRTVATPKETVRHPFRPLRHRLHHRRPIRIRGLIVTLWITHSGSAKSPVVARRQDIPASTAPECMNSTGRRSVPSVGGAVLGNWSHRRKDRRHAQRSCRPLHRLRCRYHRHRHR